MKLGNILRTLSLMCALVLAGQAHAQATRTWVSGVGDDANPCSRTAPCKTFAGAISKTAAGGVINTLDPGGYGGVTITKAITIEAEGSGEAGVLVSGTNGIIVNAPIGSMVYLRGLQLEGMGTGINGVLVLSGDVHIENCSIRNFRGTPGVGINSQAKNAGVRHICRLQLKSLDGHRQPSRDLGSCAGKGSELRQQRDHWDRSWYGIDTVGPAVGLPIGIRCAANTAWIWFFSRLRWQTI
jgi:hypothetical protein